jgi:hypothetical protein
VIFLKYFVFVIFYQSIQYVKRYQQNDGMSEILWRVSIPEEIREPAAKGSSSKGVRLSPTIKVVIVAEIGQPSGAKVFSGNSWNVEKSDAMNESNANCR